MSQSESGGGHSHGGHSHGGHSHGGDAKGAPGHGVAVERGFVAAERPLGAEVVPLSRGAGRGLLLYLDLPSGIAGDMINAALVDLGVPLAVIRAAVDALPLPGVSITLESGYAGAIGCSHFGVDWSAQGKERSYSEIVCLIELSSLDAETKELALSIFACLAKAEAQVHRTTLEHVHFHEVGAVDSIVDIVGAAAAFVFLGAEVRASPVPIGRGFVHCRHGMLPLPAPATLNCLEGVPTVPSGLELELVTPTGAAILATVASAFGDWFEMTPLRVGFGGGTMGLPDRPNAIRAILAEKPISLEVLSHVLLEANIDDMTGEVAAFALSQAIAAGAVDAWIVPATMKKGRPGMIFSVLAPRALASSVTNSILAETSSIGVRQTLVSRTELPRSTQTIQTPWGEVRVKESGAGMAQFTQKPELDDCIEIAKRSGVPLRKVLTVATQQLK